MTPHDEAVKEVATKLGASLSWVERALEIRNPHLANSHEIEAVYLCVSQAEIINSQAAELARIRKAAEAAVEALDNYARASTYEWTGDGYTWGGGKWDYRRPPQEDAIQAQSALRAELEREQ